MKVFNIILCILIFILALVSAAFSYLLFDKRASLVESNVKMATQISSSSRRLAPATNGQAIAPADLAHEKYTAANMDTKLRSFDSQVNTTVTQRDTLAETLLNISKAIGFKGIELDAVKRLGDTEDRSGSGSITEKVLAKVKSLQLRFNRNNECFREIGQILGVTFNQSNYDFTPSVYDSSVSQIREAVRRCKRDLDRAIEQKNALEAEKREIEKQMTFYKNRYDKINREKEALRSEAAALRRSNEALRGELDRLKRDFKALTRTEYGETPVIHDGTTEARGLVVGEVREVNPGHGFIAIDLNTTQRFKHKIGDKEYSVDPKLRAGLDMVICRGDLTGSKPPVFIAKIKIYSIDETCTIANIPADVAKQIKVGDKVIDISRFEAMQTSETK